MHKKLKPIINYTYTKIDSSLPVLFLDLIKN